MSHAYESINIRVPPEAKRALEREVARRRDRGDLTATMSSIVTKWLLSLGPGKAERQAQR